MCAQHLSGFVLDIGCGHNDLLRDSGQPGVGVDIAPWQGIDVLCDTTRLPFRNKTFDMVTMVACLNHIVAREAVLREAHRVLQTKGRLLLTMINPIVGIGAHLLGGRHDEAQLRGWNEGERSGLWPYEVRVLTAACGFKLEKRVRFAFLGLNSLYLCRKHEPLQ